VIPGKGFFFSLSDAYDLHVLRDEIAVKKGFLASAGLSFFSRENS